MAVLRFPIATSRVEQIAMNKLNHPQGGHMKRIRLLSTVIDEQKGTALTPAAIDEIHQGKKDQDAHHFRSIQGELP